MTAEESAGESTLLLCSPMPRKDNYPPGRRSRSSCPQATSPAGSLDRSVWCQKTGSERPGLCRPCWNPACWRLSRQNPALPLPGVTPCIPVPPIPCHRGRGALPRPGRAGGGCPGERSEALPRGSPAPAAARDAGRGRGAPQPLPPITPRPPCSPSLGGGGSCAPRARRGAALFEPLPRATQEFPSSHFNSAPRWCPPAPQRRGSPGTQRGGG